MKRSDRPWLRIPSSSITDERIFRSRRQFLRTLGGGAAAGSLLLLNACGESSAEPTTPVVSTKAPAKALDSTPVDTYAFGDTITPEEMAKRYNNFYELGLGKEDPAKNGHFLQSHPWQVEVSGECDSQGVYDIEDVLKGLAIEQRVYRLRCVEAWSMVIPWDGIALGDILQRFKPNSRAKFVSFKTLYDPEQLPGQRSAVLDWPYREGLRIDEAMNPLSLMAVGAYGQSLAPQMGAPMRLVVPWKYGFKSIKSIVGIHFSETQPATSWNMSAPREYGFFANVNPEVDHPRWSQATERRLDGSSGGIGGLFAERTPTEMYNGYGPWVASLYQGMDLRQNF